MPQRVAVYPGSFDPVTYGHLDLIGRASGLFDHLWVVVLHNPQKQPLFSSSERLALLEEATRPWPNVSCESFDGLVVSYADMRGAQVIVRGMRAVSDFDAEFKMASANRHLNPAVETLFMMTSNEYALISSSIVKEVASLGGDVDAWVPPYVAAALARCFAGGGGSKQ